MESVPSWLQLRRVERVHFHGLYNSVANLQFSGVCCPMQNVGNSYSLTWYNIAEDLNL